MGSSTTRRILMGVVALLVIAPAAHGQAPAAQAPRRSIEQISGSVYTASNNNHRTVFLVTPEGILMSDPINVDFSKWLKAEMATRFKVPVRYVVYSHHHWDHASGGEAFADTARLDRKSTRLNSSHSQISYAVFCLKKKKKEKHCKQSRQKTIY